MFGIFKKNISQKELASTLYLVMIKNGIEKPQKDNDGNVILSMIEQKKILLSYLYNLLEIRKLNTAKAQLLAFFVVNNCEIEENGDLEVEMLLTLNEIDAIKKYFNSIPVLKDYEFFKKDFLFEKKLNPLQKTLSLSWYTERCKAIDTTLEQSLKRVSIKSEG